MMHYSCRIQVHLKHDFQSLTVIVEQNIQRISKATIAPTKRQITLNLYSAVILMKYFIELGSFTMEAENGNIKVMPYVQTIKISDIKDGQGNQNHCSYNECVFINLQWGTLIALDSL